METITVYDCNGDSIAVPCPEVLGDIATLNLEDA